MSAVAERGETRAHAPPHGRPELLFEPFQRKPYDLFFFQLGGTRYVGRKTPATVGTPAGPVALKCALIEPGMLLGRVEREQVAEGGIAVFHHPLDADEKREVFRAFADDGGSDLYYPVPHLTAGECREKVAPPEYWRVTPEKVDHLDLGEVVLRDYTLRFLSRFPLEGARVFDPACSTGAFIGAVKERFPSAYTIGQDLSAEMAAHARGRADEIHHGDCADSPVPEGSCDFVFVRHLNVDVVTTARAHRLFPAVASRCRDGGRIVVFGHTPVLLSSPWFEMLGLRVEQRIGTTRDGGAAFQYYVLRKTGPLLAAGAPFA